MKNVLQSLKVLALTASAWTLAAQPAFAANFTAQNGVAEDGSTPNVCIYMDGGANQIAGVQMELNWDPGCMEAAAGASKPKCRSNPDTGKTVQSAAKGPGKLKAIFISFSDVEPIPDGLLFCCEFQFTSQAPSAGCPVTMTDLIGSSSAGQRIPVQATGPARGTGGGMAGSNNNGQQADDRAAYNGGADAAGGYNEPAGNSGGNQQQAPAVGGAAGVAEAGGTGTGAAAAGGNAGAAGTGSTGGAAPGSQPGMANAGAAGANNDGQLDRADDEAAADSDDGGQVEGSPTPASTSAAVGAATPPPIDTPTPQPVATPTAKAPAPSETPAAAKSGGGCTMIRP